MDIWSFIIPFLRVLLYLSSLGAVGTILFILHFGKNQSPTGVRYCQSLIKKSAILGVVASLSIFLSVAGNMGGDLVSALDIVMLQLALDSKAGLASLITLLGFLIVIITSKSSSQSGLVGSLFGLALVLSSFVMVGHSTREGLVTQSLLLIHLAGIAYWLGSLMPFRWMCLSNGNENLSFIAHRFGVLATRYIGALVISGLVFAYNLLGSFSDLINTTYGNVLLVKLVTVSALLSLGALNKFRFVPLLIENPVVGAKRLQSSVNFEMGLALCILFFSALLTTSLTLPMST